MSAPPLGTLFALPESLFAGARPLGAAGGAAEAGARAGAASRPIDDPMMTADETSTSTSSTSSSSAAALDAADAAGLTCACCGVGTTGSSLPPFPTPEAQREHFRGDWHRLNARRRAKAVSSSPPVSSPSRSAASAAAAAAAFTPLSEEAAAALLESVDVGNASDVSSLSGSDSESDESDDESDDGERKRSGRASSSSSAAAAALVPLVSSDGRPFALWRPLLFAPRKASDLSTETAPATAASNLRRDTRCWAVILAKGGHFAAAVFDVSSPPRRGEPLDKYPHPLAHGTAHRYVVRAKAGGRQSTKDAAGGGAGAIKSAGSSLRRYNERALEADIRKTLSDFGALLSAEKCALLFVHAPGQANAASLFASSSSSSSSSSSETAGLLRKGDPRIRSVPFAVRRPTLSEAGRVARGLLTVHSVSLVEEQGKKKEEKEGGAKQQKKKEATASQQRQGPSEAAPPPPPLPPPPLLRPDPPLVAAAKAGDAELVASLLAEFAAGDGGGGGGGSGDEGPAQREARPGGRTAYNCSATKAVRDAFRRAAASALESAELAGASEEAKSAIAGAWSAAGVPSALTPEMEAAQQAKAAEKKARLRAAEKERKKSSAAKKAAQAAQAAADEDAAIEAAAAEAAALSLNKVKKQDQQQQTLSRAALAKREQMAAAAEARLRAASARQQLW